MTWYINELRVIGSLIIEYCTQNEALIMARTCRTWRDILAEDLRKLREYCLEREQCVFLDPAYVMMDHNDKIYYRADYKSIEPGMHYEKLAEYQHDYKYTHDFYIMNSIRSQEFINVFGTGNFYIKQIINSFTAIWINIKNGFMCLSKLLPLHDLNNHNLFYNLEHLYLYERDLIVGDSYCITGKFKFILKYEIKYIDSNITSGCLYPYANFKLIYASNEILDRRIYKFAKFSLKSQLYWTAFNYFDYRSMVK